MAENNKRCTRCGTVKPGADFSKHPKAKDGLQSQCKACFAERAARRRAGKPCISCGKPKEHGVPKGARLCLSCAETCYSCKKRPRKKQHRMCKVCIAEMDKMRKSTVEAKFKDRITRVRSKYKVRKAYAAALSAMHTCCACGKRCKRDGDIHVDHCHRTGKVRGVLCFNCNAALGHVGDSIERLHSLVHYLENSNREIREGVSDLRKAKNLIDMLVALESEG